MMVFFGTVSCEIILDIGDGEIDFDGLEADFLMTGVDGV